MVRKRLLLALTVVALVGVPNGTVAAESADQCGGASQVLGTCSTSGTINGDHVDVSASTGSGHGRHPAHGGDADDVSDGDSTIDSDPMIADSGALTCDEPVLCPVAGRPDPAVPPAPPGTPTVTLADVAPFFPAPPNVIAEPNGWAIVGLDANFMTDATMHTASGRVLGTNAQVRFTPVAFAWDYGDGTHATSTTAGATWAALGIPEFSRTATSHVYRTDGGFRVALAVAYRAEYRFGTGVWRGIAGTLSLSAPALTVVAGDAKTVLVERTCRTDPQGPGC